MTSSTKDSAGVERRGPAGPGTFQSAEGSRLPKPVELLSAGLAFLSADVGEKRGPSHQHDPRDQRSQRRRGIPLIRVGQKNELEACQEHISPQKLFGVKCDLDMFL